MADSNTAKLNLTKPEVGASTDSWGTKLNADLDALDALFDTGPYLKLAKGGTGAGTAADARTNLGLGTIATQNAASVSVGALAASGDATVGGKVVATGEVTAGGGVKFGDGTTQLSAVSTSSNNLPYADRTVGFTATANGRYRLNAINVAVTLPAAPTDGQWVAIAGAVAGCSVLRNGKKIAGLSEDLTLDLPRFSLVLVYLSSTGDWILI